MNAVTQYLTVQDHLWINFQVSKKQNQFSFAKLEEAVFYQYAYGNSTNVLSQAARYALGFSQKQPFSGGNSATAFIGLITFLKMNDFDIQLTADEAQSWFNSLGSNQETAEQKISSICSKADHHGHLPEVAEIAKGVMETYASAIAAL